MGYVHTDVGFTFELYYRCNLVQNRSLDSLLFKPFIVYSYLYQIAHLGDEDDEPEFSSAMPLEEGDTFFFAPRPLRNLVLVDELDSLSPILGKPLIFHLTWQ